MQISLSAFRVLNYRFLDGLALPDLAQVNVVTGSNGVGKTALLEALWLFTGRYNSPLLWNQNVQRSDTPILDPVSTLTRNGKVAFSGIENGEEFEHDVKFVHYSQPVDLDSAVDSGLPSDDPTTLHLVGKLSASVNGKELEDQALTQTPFGLVAATTKQTGRASCVIEGTRWQLESSNEELKRFSVLVERGRKNELRDALRLIHPSLDDVEILSNERGPYLSGLAKNGRRYHLPAFGGGTVRLFRIFLATYSSRDSVVLIDEIENGLHHSVLLNLWQKLRNWATEWNVQVFATTHSRECLSAAISAFEDQPDGLMIHNLYRKDGELETATFSGEPLLAAEELSIELR